VKPQFTTRQCLAAILIILLIIPAGMAQQIPCKDKWEPDGTALRQLILPPGKAMHDPAAQALHRIRDQMTRRLIDRGVDLAEVRAAYRKADFESVIAMFGYAEGELADLDRQIVNLRKDLVSRYPRLAAGLAQVAPQGNCYHCNVDRAFDIMKRQVTISASAAGSYAEAADAKEGESDCMWGAYVSALLLCTTMGPIIYWPCAYLAYCSFCEGPLVDSLCGSVQ